MPFPIGELHNKYYDEVKLLNIVDWTTFRNRVRLGWSIEDAMHLPLGQCREHKWFFEKYGMTMKQYCEKNGLKLALFRQRLAMGCSMEEASIPSRKGKFAPKGKETKYRVFYEGKMMGLVQAWIKLCESVGIDSFMAIQRKNCIYQRIHKQNQTPQQAFNHFIVLYNKKYGQYYREKMYG